MKTKNFTTTLSSGALSWLDSTAKETGKTRRSILEESMMLWKKKRQDEALRASYAKASTDPEWIALGNMGVSDWEANTKLWETN
jgi:hypothetical protein